MSRTFRHRHMRRSKNIPYSLLSTISGDKVSYFVDRMNRYTDYANSLRLRVLEMHSLDAIISVSEPQGECYTYGTDTIVHKIVNGTTVCTVVPDFIEINKDIDISAINRMHDHVRFTYLKNPLGARYAIDAMPVPVGGARHESRSYRIDRSGSVGKIHKFKYITRNYRSSLEEFDCETRQEREAHIPKAKKCRERR